MKVGRFDFLGDAIGIDGSWMRRRSIATIDAAGDLCDIFLRGRRTPIAIDATPSERDALLRWFGGLPPVPHHMPQPSVTVVATPMSAEKSGSMSWGDGVVTTVHKRETVGGPITVTHETVVIKPHDGGEGIGCEP